MKIEISNSSLCLLSFFILTNLLPLITLAQNAPQDYLLAHNEARQAVRVSNLVWNNTLAIYALNVSNQRIGDCNIIKSGGPYGENMATSNVADFNGADAVKIWVDEGSEYDRNTNTCKPGRMCMHYTQVIWRRTEMVGCAKVRCTAGGSLVTCCYDPPGNVAGQLPY